MMKKRAGMDPAEELAYEDYALRRELRSTKEGRRAVRAKEEPVRSAGREKVRAGQPKMRPAAKRRKRSSRRRSHPVLGFLMALAVLLAAVGVGLLLYAVHEIPRYEGPELQASAPAGTEGQDSGMAPADSRMEEYTNIALFGVDSRAGELLEGNNRSDSIMIVSIHKKTGDARVVSVFRDTVLDVGDGYYTKCNAAYAYGGPSQAVAMLNNNLDLDITDFITIGFEGLASAIDALGGIELEITAEEADYINMYVLDMSRELGTKDTPVPGAGLQTLNGIQATAYCRIRYTAGDDFKRAQRQRTVLQLTAQKANKANPLQLYRVLKALSDDVVTSLSDKEMTELIAKLGGLSLSESAGFPRENGRVFAMIDGQDCIVPDTLAEEVSALHAYLFGEEDYQPSEGVQQRSSTISSLAGR